MTRSKSAVIFSLSLAALAPIAAKAETAIEQLGLDNTTLVAVPLAAPLTPIIGRDVSEKFAGHYLKKDFLNTATELKEAQSLKVLFVNGFMTNMYVDKTQVNQSCNNNVGPNSKPTSFFYQQVNYLCFWEIDSSIIGIQSESNITVNAPSILNAIKAVPAGQKVLLIAHSKGGLDTLEALLEDESVWPKIRGVITIQSPFGGSPAADMLLAGIGNRNAKLILEAMGGDADSANNLKTGVRKNYMQANEAKILKLTQTIPWLAIGTAIKKTSDPMTEIYTCPRNANPNNPACVPNDTLVPVPSAMLPGAFQVQLYPAGIPGKASVNEIGIDHSDSVRSDNNPAHDLDRDVFIRTAIKTLLEVSTF